MRQIVLLGAGGQARDMIKNIEEHNGEVSAGKRIAILGCIDDTPDAVWITLALAEKVRERRQHETLEVGYERSKHSFEKARARVLAEGKGLYDERWSS